MKKRHLKLFISLLVIFAMVFTNLGIGIGNIAANAQQKTSREKVENAIEGACSKILEGKIEDWESVGLSRAGRKVPDSYLKDLDLSEVSSATDISRTILGVLAAGGEPTNIKGHNLVDELCKKDLNKELVNGVIFGLIALDAGDYKVSSDSSWTRENLINKILQMRLDDNGWVYWGETATPDMTGMALTALAPYNNSNHPEVQNAIDKAVELLKSMQTDNGGYIYGGDEAVESSVQVIMGLCANNIDPTSEEFTKNGKNVVDAVLSFEVDDGGFKHTYTDEDSDNMATEQGLYGLDQYIYFLDKKGSIYDWTQKQTEDKIPPKIITDLEDKTVKQSELTFTVSSNDDVDGQITPVVKLNNEVVKEKNGEYRVTLIQGENQILIEAVDKSGNKKNKEIKVTYKKEISSDEAEVIVEQAQGSEGSTIELAINAKNFKSLAGGQLEINYDPEYIILNKVEKGEFIKDFAYEKNLSKKLEGSSKVAFANSTGNHGSGNLLNLEFDLKKSSEKNIDIQISNAKFNNDTPKSIKVESVNGSIKVDKINELGKCVYIGTNKNLYFDDGTNIDLGNVDIPQNQSATLTLKDISNENKPSKDSGFKLGGKILDFEFKLKDKDIDELIKDNPVYISIPVDKNINLNKASIYYFNKEKNSWEYQNCKRTGNKLTALVNNFSIYGVLVDEKAPEIKKISIKESTSKKVVLDIEGQDASGIEKYEVYRDSQKIGETNSNIYEDKNVDSNKTYIYTVKAFDKLNNQSNMSNEVSVTTSNDDYIIEDKKIHVNMRIEGYRGTHFDGRIEFDPNDYKDADGRYIITDPDENKHEFSRPTVMLATIVAMNKENITDNKINSNDNYMARMAGEEEFDFRNEHPTCGWMVKVNDVIINKGAGVWNIENGDTVEWYYADLDKNTNFGYIDVSSTNIEIGEKIKVKVTGKNSSFKGGRRETSIKDATVYVGSKEYTTDSNGEVEIEMNESGSFDVYAIKLDKSSKHDGHYFPLLSKTKKVKVKVNSPNTLVKKVVTEEIKFNSDEYEKIYNEIKDLKKEDTILRKEKNVIDELNKKIDNIKTEKEAKQVVKDISDVSKIAKLCAYKMETEKGGIEAVNNNNTILKSLSKCVDKVKDNKYKKEIEDISIYNIDVIAEITDIIKDQNQVDDIYKNMIDNSLELSKKLGKGNNNKLNEKIVDVVNDIVDKKSNITVADTKIKVQDKYVEAVIDNEVMKQVDKISNDINGLKKKLKENGLNKDKSINSRMTLSIRNKSRKRADIVIESSSVDNILNKGFDTLRLNTGIAVFNITSDTFKNSKNKIILSASKLNASDVNNLENIKIPSSSVVVDLSAKIDDKEIHEFNNINIEIPYDLDDQNKDKLKVFYINEENNNIEFIGGIYDEKSKSIVFETNHFSKYFIKEVKVDFDDLGSVKWAQEAIIAMAEKDIIKGKSGSKFSPNDNITRAEFATLITRMMGYKDDKSLVPFKDVSPYGWYYTSVSSAYSNKLINGKSEDTFDPDGNITRQEMAKIIAKVLESKGYKDSDIKELDIFKDKENISPWAKESVGLSAREGIINGMGDKTFAPNEKATRAQAAVMLYRLYKLIMN